MVATTDRLLPDVVKGLCSSVDDLALDLVGPAGVVSEAANDVRDVGGGHCDGLAVVEGLDGGKGVYLALAQVGEFVEENTTTLWGGVLPLAVLEGFTCGGDGNIDILLRGLVDGANDLLGRRVDDLEGLAVGALDELVVDEAAGKCQWTILGPRQMGDANVLTDRWAAGSRQWRGS